MAEAAEQNSTGTIGDPLWDDWDTPPRVPETPELHLSGFDGPLDLLLDLAERARIDLSQISVTDMVDQFVAAMARHENHVPLERRADWLNLAARPLMLRSRLLLPTSPEVEGAALDAVERARGRLQNLQFIRASRGLAGRGSTARARCLCSAAAASRSSRRVLHAAYGGLPGRARMEEAREQPALEQVYAPVICALLRIPDALARMRAGLASLDTPTKLKAFLPRMPEAIVDHELIARSAIASAFFASLELARSAELVLDTGERFEELTCTVPH